MSQSTLRAVLGPTNTGKTHLAVERMCAHSSGIMGFPLRLLAQEVYERVKVLKGERSVALITGEQRIEPAEARYFCCTAEAMPRKLLQGPASAAFVGIDEAQLGADPERGHIFTDRILHARGREETMILGSGTLAPVLQALDPRTDFIQRPRFSELKHLGARKLSRLPPRSAIVAFSAEQVYAVAEMLRRFRGGAAVVMGALSPETRNKQVALFQNGEVDYIVATDAIGMGLNLDLNHVAFAGLTKFDGQRQRRLTPAEMAQIAGRAGRHQRDGTFGTLQGSEYGGGTGDFTEEEIYALEEHRFAPLTKLFWRSSDLDFTSLDTLVQSLEALPRSDHLAPAPEATDLAVLKRLKEEPWAAPICGPEAVRNFWNACSLPDFRQQGVETHARFVARLWQDLREGYLGADFVASRIAQLSNVQGDIDTLQGRIAAIRSWAYICQRPDWVLAREEMAARARAAEARLSDALHARLTERFVNRRTSILLRSMSKDTSLLPVMLNEGGAIVIADEVIGQLEGFRFKVDPGAGHEDHRMLVAAAEKALPRLLAQRAQELCASDLAGLSLTDGGLWHEGHLLAKLRPAPRSIVPVVELTRHMSLLPRGARERLMEKLQEWLVMQLRPMHPLQTLLTASQDATLGTEERAVLHQLVKGHGYVAREQAGVEHLSRDARAALRRLGVTFGALDVYVGALLKPEARRVLHLLAVDPRPWAAAMPTVIGSFGDGGLPAGYRMAGRQAIRIDMAEKIIRAAHEQRGKALPHLPILDLSLATSVGLQEPGTRHLLRQAGFRCVEPPVLTRGMLGPPAPQRWRWRPVRSASAAAGMAQPRARPGNAFAELAALVR
ncbi:helicase-related protein [Porphyrobacter sp. GA68]|uniref:helicase-related protein n=1 Tax=Porphyrobacter sp. GA68 TaxID=2883480 RepID=UPI001D195AB2|nr:helicase-related protein [Porphyrobacter sp. GA68]